MTILLMAYIVSLIISILYFIYTGYVDYKAGYNPELSVFLGMCLVVTFPLINLIWIYWCLRNVDITLLKGKSNG